VSIVPREPGFREVDPWSRPIRDLGLSIAGSALEPVVAEFLVELDRAGLRKVRPRLYLSTEWGVPDGTVAIAIPFYLARAELTALHAERAGHVEGTGRADILRYLRHEMGHVVNYAYRLYDTDGWVAMFGSMSQPYREEYRLVPFSRRFVRHLPGWYAQKHPDEDWAETFAVWMTPGRDWRSEYAHWPEALAKLLYCDGIMADVAQREPLVTADDPEEDVSELTYSVDDFYRDLSSSFETFPPGLDHALRAIFEDFEVPQDAPAGAPRQSASALIRRLEPDLTASIYRWTGHFPERTRPLLRYLADRADQLGQVYPDSQEAHVIVALTTLVTTLAMNHIYSGKYIT
jgi:hypothetical protein